MKNILAVMVGLLTLVVAPAAQAQPAADAYPAFRSAAVTLATKLADGKSCADGSTVRVGIWPLDSASLPIAPNSAVQLYQALISEFVSLKPDCVSLFDRGGAGETLTYLNNAGALNTNGENPRAEIQAALRDVDYVISINLFSRDASVVAVVKLLDINGETIATPPAFPIPPNYVQQSCGTGAVPLSTAAKRAASAFRQSASDMRSLIKKGGTFADTGEKTSFSNYAEQVLIDELVQAFSDHISERQLLVRTEGSQQPGSYNFQFQYWPCSDANRLIMSATLSNADGATSTWSGAVSTADLPKHLTIVPTPEVPEAWLLSVTPRRGKVGDEISVVAEVPERCTPVFVDYSPSGKATVVPQQYFVKSELENGGYRFLVDASTRFGLQITPEDERGQHHLGFFCQNLDRSASLDQLRDIWVMVAAGSLRNVSATEAQVEYWFEPYDVR